MWEYRVQGSSTVRRAQPLSPLLCQLDSPTLLPHHCSYPEGYFVQNLQFDFFNYAGIHRSVSLYTRPEVYISDIVTTTTQDPSSSLWYLNYQVDVNGSATSATVSVKLFDSNGTTVVVSGEGASGSLRVSNPNLWWPWSMNLTQNYSYMYRLQVRGGA